MSYQYSYPHPAVTTDVVLFGLIDECLKVLLVRRARPPFANHWALPGGFLDIDEDLEDCALRELEEETGVSGVYLEQLYTFGKPGRDPRERVISVAYYALVPATDIEIRAASDARAVRWFAYRDLPELAFDHVDIIHKAQQRVASKLDYSTIALKFMPEKFTLGELQSVYECILDERLDKRNFRKRLRTYACLTDTGEVRRNGGHRPARLYRAKSPDTVQIVK